MWDDVTIGKGDTGFSATMSHVNGMNNISENAKSYWISNCILNAGAKIMKDTVEGKKLEQMIKKEDSAKFIQDWLDTVILQNISVVKLKGRIDEQLNIAYENGKRNKMDEIRKVIMG